MKNKSLCLFGGALIGAGLTTSAMADISVEDTIEMSSVDYAYFNGAYSYAYGVGEIDTFSFSVLSDGLVTFDILSVLNYDTFIDSGLRIFENDGSPLSDSNLIALNDDLGRFETDLNGSISSLDSFLELNLIAGDYTVAVGGVGFSSADAELGTGFAFTIRPGPDAGLSGGYRLDIFGDVAFIPSPSALALFGLAGATGVRRRR